MPAILAILAKLPWKWIGLALALIAAVVGVEHHGYLKGRRSRDPEVAALNGTIANMKDASAQAAADNLVHVRVVEARNATIEKESADALSRQSVDARAALARYISLHHPASVAGNAGEGGLSQPSPTSGAAPGPAQEAVVPVSDLEACTDAWVTATGWQEWWRKVSAQ